MGLTEAYCIYRPLPIHALQTLRVQNNKQSANVTPKTLNPKTLKTLNP